MFQSAYVKRHITDSIEGAGNGRQNPNNCAGFPPGRRPRPGACRTPTNGGVQAAGLAVPRPLATRPIQKVAKLPPFDRSGRFRVPVPILAATGCPRTADQGAGRLLTPRKTSACFAAARTDQTAGVYVQTASRDRGGPTGGSGGAGDTIRTGGTNVIEVAAGAATTAAWPMVPTWFSRVGFHRGPT